MMFGIIPETLLERQQAHLHRHASVMSDHVASPMFESHFRKAASPASDTSTHFGSGEVDDAFNEPGVQ
jgi:hypothetical protein